MSPFQPPDQKFVEFTDHLLEECAELPGRQAMLPSGRGGLLVVDPQCFFCAPGSPGFLPDWPEIEATLLSLGEFFRDRKRPVRVSRHLGPDPGVRPPFDALFSRPFSPADPLTGLLPAWQSPDWQTPLVKDSFSLFAPGCPGFPHDVDWLALAGVRLDRCVLASLFGAHAAGLIPLLVIDCVAAADRETHRSVTKLVAGGHGLVVTARELQHHLETIP